MLKGALKKKLKIINQHKNDMCHVQSLERDFYLGTPSSFDCVFTHLELGKLQNCIVPLLAFETHPLLL